MLAALLTAMVKVAWRAGCPTWLRLALSSLVLAILTGISVDALRASTLTLSQAAQVSQYLGVGEQLERGLPSGAHVLGPERWWWALHEHPYLSLRSLWWQWQADADKDAPGARFDDGVAWTRAEAIVVNDNVRGDVLDFPEAVQRRFWAFISTCTTLQAEVADASYFDIQVYRVTSEACG
jgi:hypothetical protein